MKIIIAPAKRMRKDIAYLLPKQRPQLLREARILYKQLKALDEAALGKLLGCNANIAQQAYHNYHNHQLQEQGVPALLAYDGIQYTYMAPQVFSDEYYAYVEEHLRILSALYGVLRPLDGVVPYRLELHDPLQVKPFSQLYDFWGAKPYQALTKGDHELLDLASAQYSRLIRKHLQPQDHMVRCSFVEEEGNRLREKGVYVKIARGEMVRYLAEINAQNFDDVKGFSRLGYHYEAQLSTTHEYVFLRKKRV